MKASTKIPTLIGLILIILLIASLSVVMNIASESSIKAFKTQEPRDIRVTNVTDNSFTVSWITDETTTGFVKINNGLFSSQSCYDERDINGKLGKYNTHNTTCKQVKPSTHYIFKIISDGKTFSNSTDVYSIYTGPTITQILSGLEPAYGTLIDANNNPLKNALVYLSIDRGQTLSTITNDSGSWLIPLNIIRSEDLTKYVTVTGDRTTEYITIKNHTAESVTITDSLNDSPVPTMILGKTYDFRKQQATKSQNKSLANLMERPNNTVSPTPRLKNILGAETTEQESQKSYSISITQPKDGASITSRQPQIEGTAIPGNKVTLTLGIKNPQSTVVTANSIGQWKFTPKKPLDPGKYSITITTLDVSKKTIALTHIFSVLKSGTQVLGEATPSATLTIEPTFTPTPVSTLAAEPIPTTGSTLPTAMMMIFSLIVLSFGLLLYVK